MTRKLIPMPKNLMFALDIGTRSVVGVLTKKVDKQHVVVDYEIMEHPDRAMFDGQIHDIAKVTEVVQKVVDALEERNGFKLEQAAIAAAGRALKTERSSFDMTIDQTKEIDKAITDSIEMQAIQLAQKQLGEREQLKSSYYCVGYSVINYYLDQSMILNPIGHKGRLLQVEIIATFLPHIVVDSLYSVVHRAGLEVMNLTLEPIASINVAIPKNLRLLNLALVDVGAGTSDIAISKDGAVTSYGMVALAGDEITEKIAQTYLLDFNSAEKLKIGLNKQDENSFVDVLGMTHTLSTEEILIQINETVEQITKEIADNMLSLNKKAPSAVFCIGGGAQIPGFTKYLATHLGLPQERVAIKSVENLEMVSFELDPLKGPEFITPIGIGVTAFEERDHDFIQVNVNDTSIRLFNSKPLQVSDALILTGYNARSLISERGDSYFVNVDGIQKEIKGEYGDTATIFINGLSAHLDSKINHKDQITVEPAKKGAMRVMQLREVVNLDASVYLNGEKIKIIEVVGVNGVDRTGDYIVQPDDVIVTRGLKTISDLSHILELDGAGYAIYLKDNRIDPSTLLSPGSYYEYQLVEFDDSTIMTDQDELNPKADNNTPSMAGASIEVLVNGNQIAIPKIKNEIVFVDVFSHIDFDLSKPQGILVLKLNGERAKYTDTLASGDIIDIFWNS
ncbi:MAG: hypothetical protein BGO41_04700 [Clostridiales bacterium 38-18]|nr:MAG: hypothetical protein BGO41_04700 [Clostridiales bacterium 38-18]